MGEGSDIEVVYDTSDPDTQWRCHMYTVTKPYFLAIAFGSPVLLLIAGMPLHLTLILGMVPYLVFALVVSSTIRRRTRAPRICSTIMSAEGIRDLTPDSDRSFTWHDVRNIEFSGGDVYFFIPFGEVFVPRTAFESEDAAKNFYTTARELWKGADKLISETKTLRLADFEADEEEQWKQFEEAHKKQSKESANNDSQ